AGELVGVGIHTNTADRSSTFDICNERSWVAAGCRAGERHNTRVLSIREHDSGANDKISVVAILRFSESAGDDLTRRDREGRRENSHRIGLKKLAACKVDDVVAGVSGTAFPETNGVCRTRAIRCALDTIRLVRPDFGAVRISRIPIER